MPVRPPRRPSNRYVDAHDLAFEVDQRAAGIERIDPGVRLEQFLGRRDADARAEALKMPAEIAGADPAGWPIESTQSPGMERARIAPCGLGSNSTP